MPKKVALLFYKFRDKLFESGGEKVNYYIFKLFKELGYDVDIFSEISFIDTATLNNINIYKMSEFDKKKEEYLFSLAENFSPMGTFAYVHQNTRHYRNHYERTFLENFIKKIFAHKRYIHNLKQEEEEREQLQKVKKIIVPSDLVKNDIIEAIRVDENRLYKIPPFCDIDVNNFSKIKNDVFTFGLSARGFALKGGYEFMISIILLNLLGYKCRATIIYPFSASSKKLKSFLEFLRLNKIIKIIDYCSDMNDFYKDIDCLVMASKREAFGLVAIEAIARKIPVIINTHCGVQDFIEHNNNGFIYDYKNPLINLFNIMKYVLNNKDMLPVMSDNALSIINELTFEKFKDRFKTLVEIYEKEIL